MGPGQQDNREALAAERRAEQAQAQPEAEPAPVAGLRPEGAAPPQAREPRPGAEVVFFPAKYVVMVLTGVVAWLALYHGTRAIDAHHDQVLLAARSDRKMKEERQEWKRQDELRQQEQESRAQHVAALTQPRTALILQVDRTLEDRKLVPDPYAVVQKFDATKFGHFTCVMAFNTVEADLKTNMMEKFAACGQVPLEVAEPLANTVARDTQVTLKNRAFQVAGSQADGYLFTYNLFSVRSNGTAAVALLLSGVKFSLANVVVAFKEEQEPVYEDKVETYKVSSGGHWTEPVYERRAKCAEMHRLSIFKLHVFLDAPAKCTDELIKVQEPQWVPEEKYESRVIKVVKEYVVKKTPVFRQSAMPPGVTLRDFEIALALIASEEAKRTMVQ